MATQEPINVPSLRRAKSDGESATRSLPQSPYRTHRRIGIFEKWRLTIAKMFRSILLLPWRDKSPIRASAPASLASSPKPTHNTKKNHPLPSLLNESSGTTTRFFWPFWNDSSDKNEIDERDKETKRRDWSAPIREATFWVQLGTSHEEKGKPCEDRVLCLRQIVLFNEKSRHHERSPGYGRQISTSSSSNGSTRYTQKMKPPIAACFAAIDGHGGEDCAAYLTKSLPILVETKLKKELGSSTFRHGPEKLKRSIVAQACRRVAADALREAEIGYRDHLRYQIRRTAPGACVALAVVFHGAVGVANLGDTRSLLILQDGSTETISVMHRANKNQQEADRVRLAGGNVSDRGRVADGLLEPSRTIGDFDLKDNFPGIISAEPATSSFAIALPRHIDTSPSIHNTGSTPANSTQNNASKFLISNINNTQTSGKYIAALVLASDGVCDTIEPNEIAAFVLPKLTRYKDTKNPPSPSYHQQQTEEIAKGLVELAMERGSTDDASAVVIEFWPPSLKPSSPTSLKRRLTFTNSKLRLSASRGSNIATPPARSV